MRAGSAAASTGDDAPGIPLPPQQPTAEFAPVASVAPVAPVPERHEASAALQTTSMTNHEVVPEQQEESALQTPTLSVTRTNREIELQVLPMTTPALAQPAISGLAAIANLASGLLGNARSLLGLRGRAATGADAAAEEWEPCPICMERRPAFAPAGCDHMLCKACAVAYLREQLSSARTAVFAQGVRCCMHSSGCEAFITPIDAPRLLDDRDAALYREYEASGEPPPGQRRRDTGRAGPEGWVRFFRQAESAIAPHFPTAWAFFTGAVGIQSATAAAPAPSEFALSLVEVKRFVRFCMEHSIPDEAQRVDCPNCGLLLLLPDEKARARAKDRKRTQRQRQLAAWLARWWRQCRPCGCCGSASADIAQCPHCHHRWDLYAQSRPNYADRATEAFIELTTRACPNRACRQRISHFHGHGCHHISPASDGCPHCHTHFCYICGRAHGHPGGGYERNRLCRHGSSYCSDTNMEANLVMTPVPHDRRCGCVICSHCRPRRPCSQCDGQCVVCRGIVPPGPGELPVEAARAAMRGRVRRPGAGQRAKCAIM